MKKTEDMVGWHHQLNRHGFGWTPGVGDGQGGLACCGSWGRKELGTTERLDWTERNWKSIDQNFHLFFLILWHIFWEGLSHFISSILDQLQFYLLWNKLDICPATAEVSPKEWFYWLFEDIPPLIHNSILYVSLSLLFFFLFGTVVWLVGSQFPNQGLNPGLGNENAKS